MTDVTKEGGESTRLCDTRLECGVTYVPGEDTGIITISRRRVWL